jgi:hypothetical protein
MKIKHQIISLVLLGAIALLSGCKCCEKSCSQTCAMETPTTVPGPAAGSRMTKAYVEQVGRYAYFWGWPMVNMHNRQLIMNQVPQPGLMGGIVPVAPPNSLCMLHDYVEPQERLVACPNQDVIYGFGILALDKEPVVIQVPDFGDRFWVYQICDQRTDGFGSLGKMYGSKPGFYLLAGPNWNGKTPDGITGVFRSPTAMGVVIPRVFTKDDEADKDIVRQVTKGITMYPLSQFDGKMKEVDWTTVPKFPNPSSNEGEAETKWVDPDKYFDEFGTILNEVSPLPGEEALYAQFRSVLDAAQKDPKLMEALKNSATTADTDLVTPLFQFKNSGLSLPYNWTTITNGAEFGVDYLTRTAAAKANIFVNKPNETRYFYLDADASGAQLNGDKKYAITFNKDELPPVKGFWSLTVYNQHHFFEPNDMNRYSLGTKNQNLKWNADGSLTLYIQADAPEDKSNWLPAPNGADLVLYMRAYWPELAVSNGQWTPPAVSEH